MDEGATEGTAVGEKVMAIEVGDSDGSEVGITVGLLDELRVTGAALVSATVGIIDGVSERMFEGSSEGICVSWIVGFMLTVLLKDGDSVVATGDSEGTIEGLKDG